MIEQLTVLQERREGIAAPTYAERYKIGALPLTAEANEQAFGELQYRADSDGVRVDRTPATDRDLVAGSHVQWRGTRWRVDRRVEVAVRSRFDLLLSRAA